VKRKITILVDARLSIVDENGTESISSDPGARLSIACRTEQEASGIFRAFQKGKAKVVVED
jgi:hypothetical protein